MAQVTGFSLVLSVRELAPTVDFFCNKLGFTLRDNAPDGWAIVSYGREIDYLVIWIGAWKEATLMSECRDHSLFLYCVVDNATEMYADLKTKDVKMINELKDLPSGMREFMVELPEGHKIAFGEQIGERQR